MSKLTQKELLQEGFLDTIRKITSPIAKGVAGAKGLAKGIAKVAAPNLSREIGSDIDKFKSIGKSAKDAFTAEKNKQINSTPQRFLENELITNWSSVFDPSSIKITNKKNASPAYHKSFRMSKVNSFIVEFEANQYNDGGSGVTRIKGAGVIIRGVDGKYKLVEIKDQNGNKINKANRQPKNANTTNTPSLSGNPNTTNTPNTTSKPKFYEALRDWKINNIGPNAANVGVNYQQLKAFLISIGVRDADRVLRGANITDRGAISVSNRLLVNVEATLKSRGITESSQFNLLNQLILLNDSYNHIYELSKH